MRNISFMLTTQQIIDETKTVTRRMGWVNAKVGDLLQACEKCQGLGKGGKIKKLKAIRLTEVYTVPLNAITQDEVIREGFPNMTPDEFVAFFCKSHKGCQPDTRITVLRFEYVK